jgi:hypothetical protein
MEQALADLAEIVDSKIRPAKAAAPARVDVR